MPIVAALCKEVAVILLLNVLVLVAQYVDWMAVLISERMMIFSASNMGRWTAVTHVGVAECNIELTFIRRSCHGPLIL